MARTFEEIVAQSKYAPKKKDTSPSKPSSTSGKTKTSIESNVNPNIGKTEVVQQRNPVTGKLENVTNYYDQKGNLVASLKEGQTPGSVVGAIGKGGSVGSVKGTTTETTTTSETAPTTTVTFQSTIGAGIGMSSGNAALGSSVQGGTISRSLFGGVVRTQPQPQIVGSAQGGGVLISRPTAFGGQQTQRFTEVATSEQGGAVYQQEDNVQPPQIKQPDYKVGTVVGSSQDKKKVLVETKSPFGTTQVIERTKLKQNILEEGKKIKEQGGFIQSVINPTTKGSLAQVIFNPKGEKEQAASFIAGGPLLEGTGSVAGKTTGFVIKGAEQILGPTVGVELKQATQAVLKSFKPQLLPKPIQYPFAKGAQILTSPLAKEVGKQSLRAGGVALDVGFVGYGAVESGLKTYEQTGSLSQAGVAATVGGSQALIGLKSFESGLQSGARAAVRFEEAIASKPKILSTELKTVEQSTKQETAATLKDFEAENLQAKVGTKATTVKQIVVDYEAKVFGIPQQATGIGQVETQVFGDIKVKGSASSDYINAQYKGTGIAKEEVVIATSSKFSGLETAETFVTPLRLEAGLLKGSQESAKAQAIALVGKRSKEVQTTELAFARPAKLDEFKITPVESRIKVTPGKLQEFKESTFVGGIEELGKPASVETIFSKEFIEEPTLTTVTTRTLPTPGKKGTSFVSEAVLVEQPKQAITKIETFSESAVLKTEASAFESKGIVVREAKGTAFTPFKPQKVIKSRLVVVPEIMTEPTFIPARARLTQDFKPSVKLLEDESSFNKIIKKAKETKTNIFRPKEKVPADFFESDVGLKAETVVTKARTESTVSGLSAQFSSFGNREIPITVRSFKPLGVSKVDSSFKTLFAPVIGQRFSQKNLSESVVQLKSRPLTLERPSTMYKTESTLMYNTQSKTSIDTSKIIKPTTANVLKTNNITAQKTQTGLRLTGSIVFPRINVPRSKPPVPAETLKTPRTPDIESDFKRKEYGYDTYVREKGRLVKVNKQPQYLENANRSGKYYVDQTTAASYKVVKSNKPASLNQDSVPDVPDSHFRRAKRLTGFTVEKNKYRIDSPGEKKGITAKGLAASRNRNAFKFGNIKVRL